MPAMWSYPWTLAEEGLEDAWKTLDSVGIDTINLASHYHSVRALQPRFPENLFAQYPGGCYFDPDPEPFASTPIDPPVNDVEPFDDALANIVAHADTHGIAVNGWVVCFHNSSLGAANPEYRMESAFGDPQDHALCPSHPAVREYLSAVVSEVADRGVAEIQLESLGYRTVLHGHGANFGHDKRQVLTTRTEELLLSQCFCDGCRDAARSHRIDLEAAEQVVQDLLKKSFANPQLNPPRVDALAAEYPDLRDLFDFRVSIITTLCKQFEKTAGGTPLNYYVMDGGGLDADDVWAAGIQLTALEDSLDRVTALCYVRDADFARQRLHGIQQLVDRPVDVGITLDPELIRNRRELAALVDAVRSETAGNIHFYHHSLTTDTQLDWIQSVL